MNRWPLEGTSLKHLKILPSQLLSNQENSRAQFQELLYLVDGNRQSSG
nr:MAG TPA: hypothetical protein [Bacteriophage sp.]